MADMPRDLRRTLLTVLGVVAVVEVLLWVGVSAGWYKSSKPPVPQGTAAQTSAGQH